MSKRVGSKPSKYLGMIFQTGRASVKALSQKLAWSAWRMLLLLFCLGRLLQLGQSGRWQRDDVL